MNLGVPTGPGSGRQRYAVAMGLYQMGRISPAQLEAYRIAASQDHCGPEGVFADLGLAGVNITIDPQDDQP